MNGRSWAFLPVLLTLLHGGAAHAGLLVEGELLGVPIRLEVGRDPDLVRGRLGQAQRLLDLKRGQVFQLGKPARTLNAINLPDPTSPSRYDLTYWGGKRLTIAGERGGYYVMTLGETTCGEAVVATWTRPLIGPLVAAVELLQRGEPKVRPMARKGCGTIPFRAYAAEGWPLLAGWIDAPVFRTSRIDMEYRPDESLFLRP